MIQMGIDEDNEGNENKPYDEISEILKKHYKSPKEINEEKFWNELSKKLDSLYHKEILSNKFYLTDGSLMSEDQRYWLGLEEYINNEVNSLKHKTITDHLLRCTECRKNYTNALDKKKEHDYSPTPILFV